VTASVTLCWDDPEDAEEFLRLREDCRRDGWLSDPSAEALRELVGASEVAGPEVHGDA